MFKAEVCGRSVTLTDVEGSGVDLLAEACGVVEAMASAISKGDPAKKQRLMRLSLAAMASKELYEDAFDDAEPSGRLS